MQFKFSAVTFVYILCIHTGPADYIGGSFTITIPTESNARICQAIEIVEDNVQEVEEFFFVDLPDLTNGIQTGNPGSAQVVIQGRCTK